MTSLASIARSVLLPLHEVNHLTSLKRSTALYHQNQAADSLYIIEDGLIKLTRTSDSGNRIILGVCGPNHVAGEESLDPNPPAYYSEAEVLTPANVVRVPREVLIRTMSSNMEFAAAVTSAIIGQKRAFAEKIELLCLHDVEYRILHYLAELSSLVKPGPDGEGYQLPITQLELADLIGATRETTSTTLNQLERRGLVRLSRRMLTIPSPMSLRDAASARQGANGASATAAPSTV